MSRPVIRRCTASRRPDTSSNTTYLPRRPTDAIVSPARACSNVSPSGTTTILRIVTVTDATVLPATALARPRAIVSTSGSSGTIPETPLMRRVLQAGLFAFALAAGLQNAAGGTQIAVSTPPPLFVGVRGDRTTFAGAAYATARADR